MMLNWRMNVFNRLFDVVEGPTELARRLGVRQSVVSNWKSRGQIPAERVLEVERVTGVSRHDLRPDLYPREPADARAA